MDMKGGGGGGPSPEQLAIQRQQLQVQQQQLALNQENAKANEDERARRIKEDARKERLDEQATTKDKLTARKNLRALSGGSVKTGAKGATKGSKDLSLLLDDSNSDDLLGG